MWRRAIPCADKQLKENSAVCELHFGERYISRLFEHTVNEAHVLSEGLKPGSTQESHIKDVLEYLHQWEAHAATSKGRFLSASTAESLRVTLQATLDLLKYLHDKCRFTYLLTCRLSQDCLEKLFGTIRQFSRCNDHPTAAQFLPTVNCLSFYDLVKAPPSGNCEGGEPIFLLSSEDAARELDTLLDSGKIDEASDVLKKSATLPDHEYPEKMSGSRLVYYRAGYIARKTVLKTASKDCFDELLVSADKANEQLATFTKFCDNGGLLSPSEKPFSFVDALEATFSLWFSYNELHSDSLDDFVSCLQKDAVIIGCSRHGPSLTDQVINFFLVLHEDIEQGEGIFSGKKETRKAQSPQVTAEKNQRLKMLPSSSRRTVPEKVLKFVYTHKKSST
ncbi:hypothetical protein HPB48_021561 [Haemaphysalis longicornis]|uniref:Transposable element P transposase-like RNase H C-terminal domain-containing protein n=1 Tax=Haemaphysalis longicornis TaxID=44386 RepID=A0A9J6H405_HAELO|nr:hypothetical protein HPB48_021561 [Haemaphysalis longicornis]